MIEIRGQQAADWQDVYAIRTSTPGALPYIRPDWVRDELAKVNDRTWPMVAAVQLPDGPKVVARANLQLGWGRRTHVGSLSLEHHPDYGEEPIRRLLQEVVRVAEGWFNRHRLEVKVSAIDQSSIALFESLGFEREARLRQAVRIAGHLVDEIALARLTSATPQLTEAAAPHPSGASERRARRAKITIRGGSADDWEAFHIMWSQSGVYWGTLQIPYPSADWNRERIQERPPARFWPLVAEVDGRVVGTTGLHRDDFNRRHVGRIGMMVHTDYQGMGVGSALLMAAIDLAEDWLGLTRLQLEVYPDNARAIALYEKHGFDKEGVQRAFAYRDGRYIDTLVMGRLQRAQ